MLYRKQVIMKRRREYTQTKSASTCKNNKSYSKRQVENPKKQEDRKILETEGQKSQMEVVPAND